MSTIVLAHVTMVLARGADLLMQACYGEGTKGCREGDEVTGLRHTFPERVVVFWSELHAHQTFAQLSSACSYVLSEPRYTTVKVLWLTLSDRWITPTICRCTR